MKAMKKKLRKFLLMLSCGLLLMSLSVGVTVAYLTDTDAVKNTFTVGKVDITMDEAEVVTETGKIDDTTSAAPDRVKANTYKIVPGRTIDKDPVIHVQPDSEKSWLFIKIENELAAIESTDEGYTNLAAQLAANGWTAVTGTEGVYSMVADAVAKTATAPVDYATFENFKIKGNIPNTEIDDYEGMTIKVTAYAVQYEGFDTAAAAWDVAQNATAYTPDND